MNPLFFMQKGPVNVPEEAGGVRQFEPMGLCPMALDAINLGYCVGKECRGFLQTSAEEGVCGMIPGALELLCKYNESPSDREEAKRRARSIGGWVTWPTRFTIPTSRA